MADIVDEAKCIVALRGDTYSSYEVLGALERAAAEIERLRDGVREIERFLDENRPGDASFVCAALLCDIEQKGSHG